MSFSERLRAKVAKHAEKASMGEREKYLETARPNDPTHENIPLLSARADHDDGGLVPVVVANEQHPTVRELRSGALAMCFKMIQLVAVLAAVGFVVFWAQPVRCSSEETSGTNSPAECQRNALLQPTSLDPDAALDPDIVRKLLPPCNACGSAYDGMCDEADPTVPDASQGLCPAGTDGYDCIVADQARSAILSASSTGSIDAQSVVLLVLGYGWFVLAPTVLCCAYGFSCCTSKCDGLLFSAIPM
jgi:hypothetical protein